MQDTLDTSKIKAFKTMSDKLKALDKRLASKPSESDDPIPIEDLKIIKRAGRHCNRRLRYKVDGMSFLRGVRPPPRTRPKEKVVNIKDIPNVFSFERLSCPPPPKK